MPTSAAPLMVTDWRRVASLAGIVAALAITAHWANPVLVRGFDHPIEQWVIDHRSPALNWLFRRASFIGSSKVVYTLGPLLGLAAWARCRTVGYTIWTVTAARPLVEHTMKLLVDRPRPDISRMVAGNGPSFPCGHVMAAAALWAMVPIVISLYVSSRWIWRASVAMSCALVVIIGASRVYLGVHWPSDVLAGLLIDALLLVAVDRLFNRAHAGSPCRSRRGRVDRALTR
ncbi:phosphatase PAP2 family protein [Pseudofrankia saprophytica]|uniref:phosphatase PAP2 family protein n=1 Tax=Pseudofrankia saprophytica TaxID=298655 RepID=UPI000313FE54|nr:phosphatase PAP2 family protein [Pseudofrankia saprophytica]OHV31441.1 phosphoesterase PA-phosphatase [Pseudofrankia sp. EUN1h]